MSEKELLPCPFCGSVPKSSHRSGSKAGGGGHVAFVACYCGSYASTAHQMGHGETVQAAIADVLEKWNRRAQPAETDGFQIARHSKRLVEQLRAEVEALRMLAAECNDYLNFNELTNIYHGSILHRKLADAAMAAKDVDS